MKKPVCRVRILEAFILMLIVFCQEDSAALSLPVCDTTVQNGCNQPCQYIQITKECRAWHKCLSGYGGPFCSWRYKPYFNDWGCGGICHGPYTVVDGITEISFGSWEECFAYPGPANADPHLAAFCDQSPPPNPCEKGDPCCQNGGSSSSGGSGSSGGGSSSSGGGGFHAPLISPVPHSPAPIFAVNYDHRYKVDRGKGMGWAHSYMYSLQTVPGRQRVAALTQNNGFQWLYNRNPDGTYETLTPGDYTRLSEVTANKTIVATAKSGEKYIYDNDPTKNSYQQLIEIRDTNDNKLTITYNADKQISTVTDDFQRTISFTYYTYGSPNSPKLLQSVTDPAGKAYTFNYTKARTTNTTLKK